MVALLSFAVSLHAWEWPVSGAFRVVPAELFPGWAFRLVPDDPAEAAARPVMTGEQVYAMPPHHRELFRTSGVPRSEAFTVVAHENGFLSSYYAPEPLWSVPATIEFPADVAATTQTEPTTQTPAPPWIEFVLWDRRAGAINPRIVLKQSRSVPDSGVPPVLFIQRERVVPPAELLEGPVTLVIPRDRLDPTRLPWELRILREGELMTRRRFVYRHDLFPSDRDAVGIELFRFDASPGRNTLVLEALRFDRTVERRTLTFTAAPREAFVHGP